MRIDKDGNMDTISLIFAGPMVLGALDLIFGNRLGIGAAFRKGFLLFGELALSMVGMIVLAPLLADLIGLLVTPVMKLL